MRESYFLTTGCAIITSLVFSTPLSAQTLIALSSTAAPSGGFYSSFSLPTLNESGQVAFGAALFGGSSPVGIFAGTPGSIQPVALAGTPAPGGGTYNNFPNVPPVLNASGQVLFPALLGGGSSTSGLFAGLPGSIQAVALQGTPTPAGGVYNGNFRTPALNNAGQVAFQDSIFGLYAGTPGSLQTVAVSGNPAPSGGNYSGVSDIVLNQSGNVAFVGTVTGGASPRGLFSGALGSLQAVALQGSPAPAGGNYSNFISNATLGNGGHVGFYSNLTGGSSPEGLFLGTAGSLQVVILYGTPAPSGGNYTGLFVSSVVNASGQIGFVAVLTGGSSSQGLFLGVPGSLQAVALAGAPAPSGGNYSSLFDSNPPILNDIGRIAFLASLTGGSSSKGLFAGLPGELVTVALVGDVIDVDPGVGVDNRTINDIRIANSVQNTRGQSFNNDGLLVYLLDFSDGSYAIYTTLVAVPEPSTYLLIGLGLGTAGICWWKYRRRLLRESETEILV